VASRVKKKTVSHTLKTYCCLANVDTVVHFYLIAQFALEPHASLYAKAVPVCENNNNPMIIKIYMYFLGCFEKLD
jgi:hypothetical protein